MSTAAGNNPRPKRDRIVIPLDAQGAQRAQQNRPRGSRVKKALGIIALLLCACVLIAIVGGYFWWQHYKTGPAYSLALIVDAAQRNDMETVDRLVDADKVIDNIGSQVVNDLDKQSSSLNPLLIKRLQTLVPRTLPYIKEQARRELMKEIKEFSARAGKDRPFPFIALSIPFIFHTKEEGDTAQVNGKIDDKPLEMTMQRDGDHWKIVAIESDIIGSSVRARLGNH